MSGDAEDNKNKYILYVIKTMVAIEPGIGLCDPGTPEEQPC